MHDYGAGASLEIAGQGPPLLVPFTRACVPEVDIAAGRVTVTPAEIELARPTTGSRSEPTGMDVKLRRVADGRP